MTNNIIEEAHTFINEGNNVELYYLICLTKNKKEDAEKLQKFLIEKSSHSEVVVEGCYYFARVVKWADKKALQQAVIDSGSAKWCYIYAENIKRANIKALQEAVIRNGDPKWCYKFAKYIEGADVDALQEAVIRSGDPKWCYIFAERIRKIDVDALQKVVLKSGDAHWCYEFAQNIKWADAEALGIEELPAYNEEYGHLYHHKPSKTLICCCRYFTYQEAIAHWSKGSASGGEDFAKKCVKIAKLLLQLTQENE